MATGFERFAGFFTLGKDINKADGEKELRSAEGIISDLMPELKVDTADEDLIKQKKKWMQKWEGCATKLLKRQRTAEDYWKGKQRASIFDGSDNVTTSGGLGQAGGFGDADLQHPLHDNLIFESLETFLPQATRRSPDPIVRGPDTPEARQLADKVRNMLVYLADILQVRLKLKSVVRNWALYFLGAAKVGWDFEENEVTLTPLRPQKFILDPDATITEKGVYTGEYLGEWKKDTASTLIERFPAKKEFITKFVQDKLGTKLQYVEWWANKGEILFWTLKDEVLDKTRNPHWNYPTQEEDVDDFGEVSIREVQPLNHFRTPQIPYVFLSVFNLGMQPFDETSLIEQNLAHQDLINRRYRQIDTNINGMNGGWAISGQLSGITKEQAAGAIEAFREGRGVWIPQGSVSNAVQRIQGSGLPTDVFNQLQDGRNELRGIFGVTGSTPQGIAQEQTVRGKIIVAQQDQSRIGGGVGEYIEQFMDRVYNMFYQFMTVYYTEEHMATIIGRANVQETISLIKDEMDEQLVISVKEGSMIPKDPLTQANQAIDLFSAGAISPLTLHERLDDPDPQETVRELVEFQQNPQGAVGAQQPVPQEMPQETLQPIPTQIPQI